MQKKRDHKDKTLNQYAVRVDKESELAGAEEAAADLLEQIVKLTTNLTIIEVRQALVTGINKRAMEMQSGNVREPEP